MAKKNYAGAKVTILAVAAAATMYGTTWLSANAQPASTTATDNTSAAVPSTSTSNVSTASTTTQKAQTTTTRAKRSRGS